MNSAEEHRLMLHVAQRLHRRFPERALEEIERLVAGLLQCYDGCRVRDYVPILVEREAVDVLRAAGSTAPLMSGP
jgi:hypothetical protein